jgi:hypothetical protein
MLLPRAPARLTTTVVSIRVYCRHSRGPGSAIRHPRSGPTLAGLTAASRVAGVQRGVHAVAGGGMPPAPRPAVPTRCGPVRSCPLTGVLAVGPQPAAARWQVHRIRRGPSPRPPSPRAAPGPGATVARPDPGGRPPAGRHCSGWAGVCRCARTGARRNSDLRPTPAASWRRALPSKLVGSTQTVNLPFPQPPSRWTAQSSCESRAEWSASTGHSCGGCRGWRANGRKTAQAD